MRTVLVALTLTAVVASTSPRSQAGDGIFDEGFGMFEFGVSVRFDATQQQLDRLEDEFQKASNLLLDVTDGQHEFGELWVCDDTNGGKAAEFWVFPSGRSRAPGRYGVAGDHISLAYTSVIAAHGNGTDGSWTIVHEFGHHTYGNRDEYSGPTPGTKVCIPVPANPADQTACITDNYKVYGANGVGLTEWCVASNHDPNGDTFQSVRNMKSCWESAKDRYDDLTVPAALPTDAPPGDSILFGWTELEAERRFVAVIDRSGSMDGSRIALARQGGKIFTNLVKNGDHLAVVSFASGTSIDFPLTMMDSGQKTAAKAAIDSIDATGLTAIGSGLIAARDVITGAGDQACQQAIVLLSDGASNTGPSPASVIPSLKDEGIVVHTIALGSGADVGVMQQIANGTGGKFFATSSAFGLNAIFALLSAETSETGVVNAATGTLEPLEGEGLPFDIDTATTAASFVVSWDGAPGDVTVSLTSPSNIVYNGSATNVDYSIDGSSVTIVVGGAAFEPGVWTVNLASQIAGAVAYAVQALSDSPSIVLSAYADQLDYAYPTPLTVMATTYLGLPLTGVDVFGAVQRPDGSEIRLDMYDDGIAPDELAADGVYTGVFDRWSTDGNYTVVIDAVNDGSAGFVQGETIDDPAVVGPDPIGLVPFSRHTEFAVSASGVPALERFGLTVDKLALKLNTKNSNKSKVSMSGRINIDDMSVEPLIDRLSVTVRRGFTSHSISPLPSQLNKVGKKDRYVFKDKQTGIGGMLDLFGKGSSQGRYKLSDKGFGAFFFLSHPTSSLDVEFEWGSMDYTATLESKASKKLTSATFSGKKGVYLTNELFVTSAKVGRNLKKVGRDKLSVRAALGGSSFNPLAGDTMFGFGTWMVTIPASEWSQKGKKLSYRSPDKKTTITYDTERQDLSIKTKDQDLSGFANPVELLVADSGFFSQRREIRMTASGGPPGAPDSEAKTFSY